MVQEYKPQAFEDRPSEKLGVTDYAKKVGLYLGLPVAGALTGYLAGKFGKNKLPYFNGQPPFVHRVQEKAITKGLQKATGEAEEVVITDRERLPWLMAMFPEEQHAAVGANFWNIVKGFLPAGILTGYLAWQEDEGRHLDLVDVAEDYKSVRGLHRTNEDLRADNEILKKQVDFVRQQNGEEPLFGNGYPSAQVASVEHQDKMIEPDLERSV